MHSPTLHRRSLLLAAAALAGCASRPPIADEEGWHDLPLPGKARSRYQRVEKAGRLAFEARAERSASMLRRRVDVPADRLGQLHFSWWVDRLLPRASVADIEQEDAVARVILGFEGDSSRLSAKTRAMFELAELLTGEPPPFATLMYVWEGSAPLESVIVNPRSDRIRKIVVDSGPSMLGRWRDHQRSIATDFERAYGEAPGALRSIALMTDSDNTGGSARTWYGPLHWE